MAKRSRQQLNPEMRDARLTPTIRAAFAELASGSARWIFHKSSGDDNGVRFFRAPCKNGMRQPMEEASCTSKVRMERSWRLFTLLLGHPRRPPRNGNIHMSASRPINDDAAGSWMQLPHKLLWKLHLQEAVEEGHAHERAGATCGTDPHLGSVGRTLCGTPSA